MIDLHCHILPGVDDGAESEEESLAMARIAQTDGISTIVATPHLFRDDVPAQDLGVLEKKTADFNRYLKNQRISVEVLAGAEIHIRHNLIEEIKKNRKSLCVNGGSYLFVEFPSGHIFSGVKNLFFEMMCGGITPIIAHPERNSAFVQNPGLLYDLVRMGAFAQANGGSLTGIYGSKALDAVRRFLEWNLIHFIASDGHDAESIPPRLSEAVARAEQVVGKKSACALVTDNPLSVLEDKEIACLFSPVNPQETKKSLSIKIPKFLRSGH